jgi:hypothetical protein
MRWQWAQAAVARGEQEMQIGFRAATKKHGLRRPQLPQVATGRRKQPLQMSGSTPLARRATGATRPQRPQGRAGRGLQAKHNAPPSSVRAVTTRTRSHTEQASASWWARQRQHIPIVPIWFCV